MMEAVAIVPLHITTIVPLVFLVVVVLIFGCCHVRLVCILLVAHNNCLLCFVFPVLWYCTLPIVKLSFSSSNIMQCTNVSALAKHFKMSNRLRADLLARWFYAD